MNTTQQNLINRIEQIKTKCPNEDTIDCMNDAIEYVQDEEYLRAKTTLNDIRLPLAQHMKQWHYDLCEIKESITIFLLERGI